jgi:hypothetical protein
MVLKRSLWGCFKVSWEKSGHLTTFWRFWWLFCGPQKVCRKTTSFKKVSFWMLWSPIKVAFKQLLFGGCFVVSKRSAGKQPHAKRSLSACYEVPQCQPFIWRLFCDLQKVCRKQLHIKRYLFVYCKGSQQMAAKELQD